MRCDICDAPVAVKSTRGKELHCKDCKAWINIQRSDYWAKDVEESGEEVGGSMLTKGAFVTTLDDLSDMNFYYGDEDYD